MDKPGPIAYLTGEYPRATDTFIQREVAALREQGISVQTCSIRRTDAAHHVGPEQRREAAQTFHVLEAARAPLSLLAAQVHFLLRHPRRYFKAIALAARSRSPGAKAALYQAIYFAEAAVLARALQKQKITHLHNHIATASCTVAMLASRLAGIPFSFTLHGPDIFFEPHRWRLDLKIKEARFVACISHFCRAQAMNFSQESEWKKLHIVHCGIAPERYGQRSDRRGAHLVFVGRMAGVKGVPVLLNALVSLRERHPELRVTLVGDGPERAALEQQAQQMGLSDMTAFVGYKSQDEVAELLQQADIFVLPSFAEGVPVVLMEAMAASCPVVTTHVAGIPELVEDGQHGFLTHPGDAASLGGAIETLLNNPARAAQMGQQGREKVSAEFNIAHEAAWLSDLFSAYQQAGPSVPVRRSK